MEIAEYCCFDVKVIKKWCTNTARKIANFIIPTGLCGTGME